MSLRRMKHTMSAFSVVLLFGMFFCQQVTDDNSDTIPAFMQNDIIIESTEAYISGVHYVDER